MSFTDLIRVVRVKQWTKNVFVFAAFIFVKGWTIPGHLQSVLFAFFAMCFASSATYLVNDIYDIEKDRAHPIKKNRPIASGRVPVSLAFILAFFFLALSFGFSIYSSFNVVFGLLTYLAIQVIYNVSWRNKSIADVACIALGFVIRVIIGALAINEPVSGWILLCTATLALMLGFGKRRHEFILMGAQSSSRKSLAEYSLQSLDMLVVFSATCAVLTYSVYSIESPTAHKYPGLILTTPFVIYGIARYLVIVFGSGESGEPESLVLKDRQLILNFIGYGVAAYVAFKNYPLPFLYR